MTEAEIPQLSNLDWENTGIKWPESRMLARIVLHFVPMHVEAFEVRVDEERGQVAADENFEHELTALYRLAQCDEPFTTITINSRDYVIAAYPST